MLGIACAEIFPVTSCADATKALWVRLGVNIWSVEPQACGEHYGPSSYSVQPKLQSLVYDIPPSTTAVFSYALGSRKLSANEQFFGWCSNSGMFLTNNSNKTRCIIYNHQQSLHQHTNKTIIVWIETELLLFFYPGWMRLMFTCVLWC